MEDSERVRVDQLPRSTKEIAELLADRLNMTVGPATVELVFTDGRLEHLYRKDKLKAAALERFDDTQTG